MQTSSQNKTTFTTTSIYTYIQSQFKYIYIHLHIFVTTKPKLIFPYSSCSKWITYNRNLRLNWEINSFTTLACRNYAGDCIQKFTTLVHKKVWDYNKPFHHAFVWLSKHFLVQKYNHHIWKCLIKSVFLMQNFKCIGLTELQKLNEIIILPTQHCCLTAKSLWNLKTSGTFRDVFINKNITYKKHLKRKTKSQTGIFLL